MAKKKSTPTRRKRTSAAPAAPAALVLERGPRKQRPAGPPPPRFTTHKVRTLWFQSRASYPFREADVERLVSERERTAPVPSTDVWTMVGPSNIGGRCTSLAVHPAKADTVYIGAAGGGVWRSDDAGKSWTPQWHNQPVLNIGALAIDPKSPDTVFCGTGEANGSADSYAGVGLFWTQNGGTSWEPLASTGLPRRIGSIAIDPFDSNHIVIGGVTHSASDPAGLYSSNDRGKTWTRADFVSTANYWCNCVVFHPATKGVLFATVDENGENNGIWRSQDGGKTWTQLKKGLPDPSAIGRVSLAIAPSKPDTMYAIASASGEADPVLGVYKSTNGGTSWSSIGGAHFKNERQMSYGNCIAVHPQNANQVICGGVDLHLTTDGGKTWKQVTKWNADRGKPNYAHADHHALAMPAAQPGRIYDANDGGMDLSENGGTTWTNRSNGLAATMFYDIDVSQTDGGMFGGGAQDNGTIITTDDKPDDFSEILGGDGGWMVIDPGDPSHLYASSQYFSVERWRNSKPDDVTPSQMTDDERKSIWMTYICMDPKTRTTVYAGTTRMWKTTSDGSSWQPVSPFFDGTAITAIEVAPANPAFVYAGTDKGGIFRSQDGGATWSGNIASSVLPGKIVTRIETHPKNAKTVFATVGGTGHSHVYRSDDAGTTWRPCDGGQLPDSPHNAIAIRPDAPDTMFVASNAGVYRSDDAGVTWKSMAGNLPNTMFVDLVYHTKNKTLWVATYGRSIWRTDVK